MRIIPKYYWDKSIRNIDRRNKSFRKQPWSQGVLLLGCVLVAMLLANLPFTSDLYKRFLEISLTINLSSPHNSLNIYFPHGMTIEGFINDILMVVFFFTVGLEIRREISSGELSSPKKAFLPVIAAFGGVVMPALIYTFVNHGTAAGSGWGIPTATDIAFAICILSVLGDKVPVSLKVFLTALAIADDLIAILVVAIFYGGSINLGLLSIALCIILLILFMRRTGVLNAWVYMFFAVIVWILFYYSGVHATMSGVVMAFLIPGRPRYNRAYFERKNKQYLRKIAECDNYGIEEAYPNGLQRHCLRRISVISRRSMSLTDILEHELAPWVNFIIMPLFALANAGVEIPDPQYLNIFRFSPEIGSVGMGIFFGLLLGKPIGITLSSFVAIKCKLADMPKGASWAMMFAVACLGGIGFTMSIFVDTLSFGEQTVEITEQLRGIGKIAVLFGSIASGILGSLLITFVDKLQKK